MSWLAVFAGRGRGERGVHYPGFDGKTWDWRCIPGSPQNTGRVLATARVLPLTRALETHWTNDAHFVPYVLHGPDGEPVAAQPRVTKGALAWVESLGYRVLCHVLVTDLDTPGHVPWTQALFEQALEEAQRCEALQRGGWYFTSRGRRLIHLLREPVPVDRYEAVLDRWFDELEAQGLVPDRKCSDWTHLYRAPWVERRDGFVQRHIPFLEGMVARDAPVVPPGAPRAPRRVGRTVVAGVDVAASLPPEWQARALVLGEAVRVVETEWHTLFLTLAGALCERGAPLGLVPAIVAAVSAATGNDTRPKDRLDAARTTVQRFLAGEPIRGADHLLVGWPEVAAALEQVLGARRAAPASELPPAALAARQLERAIEDAPDGVSVVAAGCGVGKTCSTVSVALRLAGRGRTPKGRAVQGSKTAISEPTNAMAKQVVAAVRARGGKALRVFSPASELDAQEQPVCRFVESARALAGAGLSVAWELCNGRGKDPCPHRTTCPAAEGQEGDPDAHVLVGNHGLLSMLVKRAGRTGLRVIDEPPALLATHALVDVDFAAAHQYAHCFKPRYLDGLRPALEAFAVLLHALPLGAAARDVATVVDPEVVAAARTVQADAGPGLRWLHVRRAREHAGFAADLARGTRATWVLYRALTAPARWVVRREERGGVPTLLFTGPNEDFVAALRAEGRTVVLDANPDLAVLGAAAGYDLGGRVTRVAAADGAPIARTHLHWANGSRRALVEGGVLRFDRFAAALRAALAWAAEDPACRALGLITLYPFRLALEVAQRPGDALLEREWQRRGYSLRLLKEARAVLAPVLARWPGTLLLGHYGAVRGLDTWKDVDALVTIADPWPNLGDVRNDVAYLGGTGDVADQRLEWLARVELEQAHGRLRAPHRARPARALHVGRVLPEGPGWDRVVEVRRLAVGRPATEAAATVEQLRAWIERNAKGSIRGAARQLGLTHTALRRYLAGARAIPTTVARHIGSGTEMPSRYSLLGVSVPHAPALGVLAVPDAQARERDPGEDDDCDTGGGGEDCHPPVPFPTLARACEATSEAPHGA